MRTIRVCGGDEAAAALFDRIQTLVADDRPSKLIVLPGGSSPVPLFHHWRKIYSGLSPQERKRWESVRIILADERMVAPDHPDSNAHLLRGHLTSGLPGLDQLFHPFPWEGKVDPSLFLDKLLSAEGGTGKRAPDLVILGIGEDGHVASLFPCCPEEWDRPEAAFITSSPDHPHRRITLSFSWINRSSGIVLLALGPSKAAAVKQLLSEDSSIPASRLEKSKTVLITDQNI
jgi:6-phosphogluconolactonase